MKKKVFDISEQNTCFTVSQQLTLAYQEESLAQQKINDMNTINNETFDDKSQETEPYQPSQIVEYLTCPNQQTIDLNEFVQNVKKGDIKKPIFNIDYFFFKFQDVRLDYSKGGYSNIEIVKDQKERILIRKTVNNAAAFENELNFFQQMDNKYLVNIYYYSKCDKEFYLEKGDETLYSFFKNKLIKNRFFLFLLCLTLVEAVTSLHLSNIFHGDIKPQNIIIFFKEGFNLDDLQQDKNISIKIYSEALCPDCQQFILGSLQRALNSDIILDYLNIQIYFYGNAEEVLDPQTNLFSYRCQHGPKECEGNRVSNCIMNKINPIKKAIELIICLEEEIKRYAQIQMVNYDKILIKCYQKKKITNQELKRIIKCYSGEEGNILQHFAAQKTESQTELQFVPWILVNGKYDIQQYSAITKDLILFVCDYYKQNRSVKLPFCQQKEVLI